MLSAGIPGTAGGAAGSAAASALSATAAEHSPVAAIVDAVVERFEVGRGTAEADALELLDALRAREAIVLVSSRP